MHVQMVGGQVRDHRPLGAVGHIHQLERTQLHHGVVLRLHPAAQGQQGRADIAPQPDPLPRRLEHFGDQGGGGGFSVRPGDADEMAGRDPEDLCHQCLIL